MSRNTAKATVGLETPRLLWRGGLPASWRERAEVLAAEIVAEYPHALTNLQLLVNAIAVYEEDASVRSDEAALNRELSLLDEHLAMLEQNQATTFEEYEAVIGWLRFAKEQAIDYQDFERAASMRDREKRALMAQKGNAASY